MDIKEGIYLRKKDNKRFNRSNKFPVVKVYETHIDEAQPNFVFINGTTRIKPDWVEEISLEEYTKIKLEFIEKEKIEKESKVVTGVSKDKVTFVTGDYIRKSNWNLFFSDQLPAIRINSIKKKKGNYEIIVNDKYVLCIYTLVKLTEEEFEKINNEFLNLKLSPSISEHNLNSCIREKTGEYKKNWDKQEALRYCFHFNKTNHNKKMNAYICPHCSTSEQENIHVGKIPLNYIHSVEAKHKSIPYNYQIEKIKPIITFVPGLFDKISIWDYLKNTFVLKYKEYQQIILFVTFIVFIFILSVIIGKI